MSKSSNSCSKSYREAGSHQSPAMLCYVEIHVGTSSQKLAKIKDGFDINLTKEIVKVVNIPVIASGGCGKLEHFVNIFQETEADAALAASVFHYDQFSIAMVKKFLSENQVLVRPW